MARTIAQRELRNENAKVIEVVTAGESFVITRDGEPVAELRPIRAGRRTFVPARRLRRWRSACGSTGTASGPIPTG